MAAIDHELWFVAKEQLEVLVSQSATVNPGQKEAGSRMRLPGSQAPLSLRKMGA